MKFSERYIKELKRNIKELIENILCTSIEFFPNSNTDNLVIVFETILNHLGEMLQLKKEEVTPSSIKKMLQPIKYLINLLLHKLELLMIHYDNAKEISLDFEKCINQQDLCTLIKDTEYLIENCKKIILKIGIPQNVIKLNAIQNIEKFLKLLKTPVCVTVAEKEFVRQYFHMKLKDDFLKREHIIKSINEGFTMKEDEFEENRVSYVLPNEWNDFLTYYKLKNEQKTLEILQRNDPTVKLEDIFDKNHLKKRDLTVLCRRISLSSDVTEILEKLLKDSDVGNSLAYLLDRIQKLENIFTGEEDGTLDLWTTENVFLEKHIFQRYVEDPHIKLATEALVMDCMLILDEKITKSGGLFQGIDIRNVLAHEDIIIQNICDWFDPSDLPKDIVRIVIDFLKDKRAIFHILSLFKKANESFREFLKLLQSEIKEKSLVDERNVTIDKYRKYIELIPDSKCCSYEI